MRKIKINSKYNNRFRENLKQEERARLVNDSEPIVNQQTAADKKKKKKIIFGAIGLLVLIGVILAIVLPLTLKKSDDSGFNPIDSQEFNAFAVDETTIVPTVFNISFVLKNKLVLEAEKNKKLNAQSFMGVGDSDHKNTDYKPVNPKDIPYDTKDTPKPNNHAVEEVRVHIDMVKSFT